MYNLFSTLKSSIEEFDTQKVTIAGKTSGEWNGFSPKNNSGGYQFSQKDTLDLIDLYYNSKYEKGLYDSEGMRKAFLNISKFRVDVAAKQTDIDVKNYVFIPEEGEANEWKTFLMQKKFAIWARENYYGILINELNRDYSKYGTAVIKRVGNSLSRVPLRSLRNSQEAKSLKSAVESGGYVIEEHEMSKFEMEKFKDWDVSEFEYDKKYKIFEMYTLCPLATIKEANDKSVTKADWDKYVMCVAILCPEMTSNGYQDKGKILFIEEIKELPYQEVHWDKQDGRWLGLGEVENQFENQIARNFTINLRRRALLWGAKKVFQSAGDKIAKNLVRDVADGEILQVEENGQITQVGMESRNLAEFGADEQVWDRNSDQKAFTYEVVTGEGLPSGTPFRLGVILSNAVAQHFELKREQLGLFLEKSFFTQLIPIFKKETKEHSITFNNNTVGSEKLLAIMKEYHTGVKMLEYLKKGQIPSKEAIETLVQDKLEKSAYLYVNNIPDKFYDDAKFYMNLQITGEAEDTKQSIETILNILQMRMANPQAFEDPENRKLANLAVSKTGKNLDSMIGKPSNQTISNALQATNENNTKPAGTSPVSATSLVGGQ